MKDLSRWASFTSKTSRYGAAETAVSTQLINSDPGLCVGYRISDLGVNELREICSDSELGGLQLIKKTFDSDCRSHSGKMRKVQSRQKTKN